MKLIQRLNNQFDEFKSIEIKCFSHLNNFDLIRLLASLQVAVSHSVSHFEIGSNPVFQIIEYFPGVPIFFTLSGFLITSSFIRTPDIKQYLLNRCLRIFPALWVCLCLTVILLFYFQVLDSSNVLSLEGLCWILGQLTLFQFYTPDVLRSWGVGTPNGSLWTIDVEFQFYILLPLILALFTISNQKLKVLSLSAIFVFSLVLGFLSTGFNHESLYAKLLHISVLPYLHYFFVGIFAYLFWNTISKFLIGRAWQWAILYFFYSYMFHYKQHLYELDYSPNLYGWISNILLSLLILSVAFTKKEFSNKILKGNDISYGIYIYHMVVINTMLSFRIQEFELPIALVSTIIISFVSWKLIERPSLRLKYSKQAQSQGPIITKI